jgi:site-specific DNA-methyltransferase (adenine-specific)
VSLATVHHGDALDLLAITDRESVSAIICDPPYGLEFSGEAWDRIARSGLSTGEAHQAWHRQWTDEALRVLKPGGFIAAFGGSRTWHRLTCAIEDSGFEQRDCLLWLYGKGMPKTLNVAKAVDDFVGTPGEWVAEEHHSRKGKRTNAGTILGQGDHTRDDNPDGLRHVYQPGGAGQWWQGWETALKPAYEPIVLARKPIPGTVAENVVKHDTGGINVGATMLGDGDEKRWPANVLVDDEVAARLGKAARYFYTAKASSAERVVVDGVSHPTVKPLAVMRWLVRLLTPRGGLVLDPFGGSGTTAEACILEGFDCEIMEQHGPYLPLIRERIARAQNPVAMRGGTRKQEVREDDLFGLIEEGTDG